MNKNSNKRSLSPGSDATKSRNMSTKQKTDEEICCLHAHARNNLSQPKLCPHFLDNQFIPHFIICQYLLRFKYQRQCDMCSSAMGKFLFLRYVCWCIQTFILRLILCKIMRPLCRWILELLNCPTANKVNTLAVYSGR